MPPIEGKLSPFDRPERSIKAKAIKTERQLAKRLGGRAQPASGAVCGYKGDVKTHDFLIDSKETKHGSYSLTLTDLTKISREADGEGKDPALVIKIQSKTWVCIPIEVFETMRGKEYGR